MRRRWILRAFGICLAAGTITPGPAAAQPAFQPEAQSSETRAAVTPETAPQPAAAEDAPLVWGTPAETRIRGALGDAAGVDILFVETPLKDAMDFLADGHGITIIADGNALTEAGVTPETPINAALSGITLRSALRIILGPMGLTTIVEDEVLKVTTVARAEGRMATRVYNLGAIGGDTLIDRVVRESVATDTWRQGGGDGTVVIAGRSLVVTQTHAVHDQVEALLRQMQRAHAAQAQAEPQAAPAAGSQETGDPL